MSSASCEKTCGEGGASVTDLPDGFTLVRSIFADVSEADVVDAIDWRQVQVRVFGKAHNVPRLTSWYGSRAYTYAGIAHVPRPLPTLLTQMLVRVESTGYSFNSLLCNLYRHGSDSVAWHADDEPELGLDPVIASVSLGAPRRFTLKERNGKGRWTVDLGHGDLLTMYGRSQADYLHSVPKTSKPVGPRVNLTFRTVHTDDVYQRGVKTT